MKTKICKKVLLVMTICSLLSFDLPGGWHKAGVQSENYEMEIAKDGGPDGSNAATIISKEPGNETFGILMQMCSPEKYLGKQIKMTGYVRSENVAEWAGMWMRVDQPGKLEFLSIDNMKDRAIKGTTEWKKYEILLPVPSNTSRIAFGAMLSGAGQIWFDDITFEVIDNSDNPPELLESGRSDQYNYTEKETTDPVNLNFDQ